jgi:hypothetical protein
MSLILLFVQILWPRMILIMVDLFVGSIIMGHRLRDVLCYLSSYDREANKLQRLGISARHTHALKRVMVTVGVVDYTA